jgi:hypothetical protein
MKWLAIGILTITLAACQHGIQKSQSRCAEYGFVPGTYAYSQCVQDEELARRARGAMIASQGVPRTVYVY